MKRVLIYTLFVMIGFPAMAQAVFTHTVNVRWTDNLSQSRYKSINTENNKLIGKLTANTVPIYGLKSNYEEQSKELTTLSSLMRAKALGRVSGFINGKTFSTISEVYQSMGYIQEKYPLLNLNPGDTFRNGVIQARYSIKLNREKKRVAGYVNTANPIPEGERIYLILSTIENVINITLQNEEY